MWGAGPTRPSGVALQKKYTAPDTERGAVGEAGYSPRLFESILYWEVRRKPDAKRLGGSAYSVGIASEVGLWRNWLSLKRSALCTGSAFQVRVLVGQCKRVWCPGRAWSVIPLGSFGGLHETNLLQVALDNWYGALISFVPEVKESTRAKTG